MTRNQPFAGRLKEARLRKSTRLRELGKGHYSQERLGIDAGIAEETASARMNQYEKGVHLPDLDMAARFAELLDVPLAYLFCAEDDLAELLLLAYRLTPMERASLINQASKTPKTTRFSDDEGFGFVTTVYPPDPTQHEEQVAKTPPTTISKGVPRANKKEAHE